MSQKKLGSGQNSNAMLESIKSGVFPDLNKAKVLPFNLMADYWTPETMGETKRMVFIKMGMRKGKGKNAEGEEVEVDLPCCFFMEEVNGIIKSVVNGSKKLVGALEGAGVLPGDAVEIIYLGQVKNKTNAYKSDNWSINFVIVEGFEEQTDDVIEYEDLPNDKKESTPTTEKATDPKVKAAMDDLANKMAAKKAS